MERSAGPNLAAVMSQGLLSSRFALREAICANNFALLRQPPPRGEEEDEEEDKE